jgi:hypothetical protein
LTVKKVKLTVSDIVNAVQVLVALLVVHVLTAAAHDLQWVFFEEELNTRS